MQVKRFSLLAGSVLVFCWDCLERVARGSVGGRVPRRGTVLVYHEVGDADREAFERQMRSLRGAGLNTTVRGFLSGADQGHKVLVTFDDAFAGTFRNAIPILAGLGIPCIVFVPVGCLGAPPNWKRRSPVDASESAIATPQVLQQHVGTVVTFGAHGVNHLSLLEVPDDAARAEILESRRRLEEMLGVPVVYFAFPYGHYEARHVEWCRQSGYEAVFGVTPRWPLLQGNGFLIFRTPASPQDWPIEFYLKCRGAYRWHGAAARLKQWVWSRCARWGLSG
jgi:peptidoglycan/xylan/chitin deacetylase (PgdA/CDA1 family)